MRIRKLVSLLLTILLAGGMFSLPVEAQEVTDSVETETVVFVSGTGNNNNPGTLESPKQTFGGAVALLASKETGGTIVVTGDINVGPWVATKLNGKITVTSKYGGVDYGAKMNFGATGRKAVLVLQSEAEFNNITFNHVYSACSELWTASRLTIGENVRVLKNGEDAVGANDFAIRLGSSQKDCTAASVTVESGKFSFISGGNNAYNVEESQITIKGDTEIVAFVQGGGTNHKVAHSTVDISGGKVPALYVNGYGTAEMEDSHITISGNSRVMNILDARTQDTKKLKGDSSLVIEGGVALERVLNMDLDSTEGILGIKRLEIRNAAQALAHLDFSELDEVELTDSDVILRVLYRAPSSSMTVGPGSLLRLTKDTVLPNWEGPGSIVLDTGDYPTHDYTGDPYSESLYLSYTKSASSQQGMALYGDYAFLFYHGGSCDVIDLRTKAKVGNFLLGSSTGSSSAADSNHANQAVFSETFYEEGDAFPLLYVTTGNSGDADEDGYYGRCAVERVTMAEAADGTLTFSSTLMQTIVFNDNGYETGEDYKYEKAGITQYESPCWGWPASFADTENGKFYLFSARYRTSAAFAEYYDVNAYIITSFDLPEVSQAGEKVILYPEDITDQFTTEFDVFVTQGGTLYDGKIYYTYGFGGKEFPNAIRVFDLAEKKIVGKIDLSESIFMSEEIESCGVYEGTLLCNTNTGKIYQLDYVESLPKTDPETGKSYTECCICGEILSVED